MSKKNVLGKLKKMGKATRYDWTNSEQMAAVGLPPEIPPAVDPMVALKVRGVYSTNFGVGFESGWFKSD